ncbi:class I SAM-dependent methyltransferase [Salinicoccus sediminis]|uniref:class I SAM-dependent methyltransferase n=1 Tax=Salinicoccus sediminis TaxID=1432562 RepID=UPI000699BD34|nr:class I SAM-dependent methyltransferase [Salinicoccus sediminis]
MKRVLGDGRHGALLDYSGGTGLVSLELAGYFDSALIADASEKMVKVAEAKISRSGLENFEALHLDLTKGNSELKADVILVSLVLLHVPGTAGLL